MRRYSPPYYSPPRRGYGGRERSPPRRGYGGGSGGGGGPGGYGRHKERMHGSLLVRNIPLDCRAEELRIPFERFGPVRDIYLPRDYYTGQPRGFAFVEFVEPHDAADAQYHMDGQNFAGRKISVVVAAENRKRPEEMRRRTRREPSGHGGRSYHGRSRSRSRSPRRPSASRSRHRSRSYSPVPRKRGDHSVSPSRRHADDRSRSPRAPSQEREGGRNGRSYSPDYDNGYHKGNENGKSRYESGEAHDRRSSSPAADASRSPSGSRSRSPDPSPSR
ncbi:serine/arginine-rich SC35-like splicing factor SCL30 isoform X1 [Syzygium oleosum]|uniref:serine/arginine-rich SC35-like splicing factor SCL30 isoform X1 n=1 Tax=Syzygium oleosum TaxID=219896 RepID=UPI0011D1927B|nr:serine/arginine-rich SC35-like splicing factor SCL30 isoform X1 [Syzygium oleosum]